MADAIILKNKNLTIKVSFADNIVSGSGKNIYNYSELEIDSNGIVKKYISDEKGFIKKEVDGAESETDILLTEFALKEKRSFYKNLLQNKYSEIENIVVLSGSGTSVDIGNSNKGLTMSGLWDEMNKEKDDCLITLIKETKYAPIDKEGNVKKVGLAKDLEALLSSAAMNNFVFPNQKLTKAIKTAKEFIAEKCTLVLPEKSPHLAFLHKITLRPQKYPRIKLFTLNYDTLFEQAAGKEKYTVIDGFTFSNPRVFNGKYFDYDIIETTHNRQDKKDSTIGKLFYLFKMHGSINWQRNNSEIEQFDGKEIDVDKRIMIFPQSNKYEHSYEQPYFEMMARFQQALRTENTLLITIGFSFLDKHISSVILESMKQNASLNLLVFTFPEVVTNDESAKEYQKELHQIAEIQSRVTLIAETFEDLAREWPENTAHKKFDLLEELNENLKKIKNNVE